MSSVKNLKRDYGDFCVDIPEWELSDKGITCLSGPSGSGKTTVFRLLLGLEPCPDLQWIYQGQDLARLSPPDRKIGVVFQSLELFPHMSALGNIQFAADVRGIKGEDFKNKLEMLGATLSLMNLLDRKAEKLSGGEQQRVALARALIGGPRWLFLDEPFTSLDIDLKNEARNLVRKLVDQLQVPTLLVTHDPEDIRVLSDHVVKIQSGKLI